MSADRMSSLMLLIALAICGCGSPVEAPKPLKHYRWDFSKSRNVEGIPWFDFRPGMGSVQGDRASNGLIEVDITFDESRSYRGLATDVYFDGAEDDKTRVRAITINLPAKTASETIESLQGFAKDWGLSDKRLKEQERLIHGPPVSFLMSSGIVLFSHGTPEISVELFDSFDLDRPWSITVQWSFEPFAPRPEAE